MSNESIGGFLRYLDVLRHTCRFHAACRIDSVTKQLGWIQHNRITWYKYREEHGLIREFGFVHTSMQ